MFTVYLTEESTAPGRVGEFRGIIRASRHRTAKAAYRKMKSDAFKRVNTCRDNLYLGGHICIYAKRDGREFRYAPWHLRALAERGYDFGA